MNKTLEKPKTKIRLPVPIGGLISILHNIQMKIDAAAGAATALELRLRVIAQLDSRVKDALKQKTKKLFYRAELEQLIEAVLTVFHDKLDAVEQEKLRKCRPPRNKTTHASFAELMIALNGEAPGREIDPDTLKPKLLDEDDVIEGAICIERNRGLDDFAKIAREVVLILEQKILRFLQT